MSINNRIQKIIDELGITIYEFSKQLGNKRPDAIYALLKENSEIKPSPKTLEKIRQSFPQINYTWLLTGEGEMLIENQENNNVTLDNSLPKVKNNNISVPYYDVDFAGGWDSEEMFSNQLPAFYITSPDFAKAEFSCNLVGNSISNRIPSGAIIGLREIFDWQTYFPTNELYGVLTKNDLRTVKIVKRSKTKGFLTLMPDPLAKFNHTGYEPEEIPIEFVARFYQVVAWACFEKLAM